MIVVHYGDFPDFQPGYLSNTSPKDHNGASLTRGGFITIRSEDIMAQIFISHKARDEQLNVLTYAT